MTQKHRNNLGLVGDGDELYFIDELEAAFSIKFSSDELVNILTMGDLHDAIAKKLNLAKSKRMKCPTSVVFYRVRKALKDWGVKAKIMPSTKLDSLTSKRDLKDFWTHLENGTGLRMPSLVLTSFGFNTLRGLFITTLATSIWFGSFLIFLSGSLAILALGYILPRTINDRYLQISNLVRHTAAVNFGVLAKEEGSASPDDFWAALKYVARMETGYTGIIDRKTYLINPT